MSDVTTNQPEGTPTWIDLGVPDLDRAMRFYGAVFGWEFDVGPAEYGSYTMCRLRGRRAAGLSGMHDPALGAFWNVYLATDDCDRTAARIAEAGGDLVMQPMDVGAEGRMALVRDPVGAQFGIWQGGAHVGCEVVNEAGALLRNDLVTADPGPAREFYTTVFGFTLDGNENLPGLDFAFLRRPDGHEIGGITGVPGARSVWTTLFEVDDTDTAVQRARAAGGTADDPQSFVYGRTTDVTDPFGAVFTVGSRPAG